MEGGPGGSYAVTDREVLLDNRKVMFDSGDQERANSLRSEAGVLEIPEGLFGPVSSEERNVGLEVKAVLEAASEVFGRVRVFGSGNIALHQIQTGPFAEPLK